jgi:cathepsin A (carboxypeptidase C)
MSAISGLPTRPRFNLYDIRLPCSKPPLCYDFSPMDNFLAKKDVIAALNVTGRKFQDCNKMVHYFLLGDWMLSLQEQVTYLLENKVHVLVYSGDKDFICNWRGGEKWTNVANWTHGDEFRNASY